MFADAGGEITTPFRFANDDKRAMGQEGQPLVPPENPYLSRRFTAEIANRSPSETPLAPLVLNHAEGLRQRRPTTTTGSTSQLKTDRKLDSTGFIPPPRQSYSLGASIDAVRPGDLSDNLIPSTAERLSPTIRRPTIVATTESVAPVIASRASSRMGYWVLVYGYSTEEQYQEILRLFRTFGRVLDYQGPCQPGRSNWVALQYETRLDAERARCHQHVQLMDGVFCGVKLLDNNDPFLLRVLQPALSSLWSARDTKITHTAAGDSPANTDKGEILIGPTRRESDGKNMIRSSEWNSSIFVSDTSAGGPQRERGGLCEQFQRWFFAIQD